METITTTSALVTNLLKKNVSYQKNTWSAPSKEMTIADVLIEIKSNTHKHKVQSLRYLLQEDKKEEYNSHKQTLPAITFCATFDGERKKSKIKVYNAIIVLDVDKLNDHELNRVKHSFKIEPVVISFWVSPSNRGVKGLVCLTYNFELNEDNLDRAHKGAFKKVSDYFNEQYNINIDGSGSDTTRLCFFSHDPEIVIKENTTYFEVNESDILPNTEINEHSKKAKPKFSSHKDALHNPKNRNAAGDRYIIASIIRFLTKKNISITYSYEEWYRVAMAIANSFTYEVGEKYFLKLSSIDKTKFNEVECKNFLTNCYETRSGAIKFKTIVYFANEKSYLTKRQRERGSEAVDESLS